MERERERESDFILTFDVQLETVGEGSAFRVGGQAVVVARVVAVEVLQHQALVTHDDTIANILTKLLALKAWMS